MNGSQLRKEILGLAGRLLKWTTAKAQGRSGYLQAGLPPVEPLLGEGGEDPTAMQPVRIFGQFGVRSQPPTGSELIVAAPRAGKSNGIVIASENLSHGPIDLAEGETAVYDKAGSVVRLNKDGSITITSKGGGVVTLDKDGNVTVVPAAGKKVQLGDSVPANLDPVVLVTALITAFNSHVHTGGILMGALTGTPNLATALTSAVGSSNVQGKK